jgi:hypothetical protein
LNLELRDRVERKQVEQQGEAETFRREEALMAVAHVSIREPRFLQGARNNLEHTLWRYGFALSPGEVWAVKEYFRATNRFDDQEIIDDLKKQLEEPELSAARRRRWRVG